MRCEHCGRLDPWRAGKGCHCLHTPNQLRNRQPQTGEALTAWLVRENRKEDA